jgi:hypothetical protein
VHFRAFEHIVIDLLLIHVDAIHVFQNYSLMENDTGSHQIMPRLDGVMHSESVTGNI